VHFRGVENEVGGLSICSVVLDIHEDDSIIGSSLTCFSSQCGGPEVTVIAPGSSVVLGAPRISQFHESHAVRELFHSENDIGVIADETFVVGLGVTFTGSCSHHDVVLAVVFHHLCPKGVRID